ncbi:hypothetical protein ACFWIB_15235 [Streptomyces sp. NPDC127051]|uniref:hypothetical protein n=1 Tax=Streptomyces sp. NPDC127051 TaxID=3347119 RepID=UPI003649470A
MDYWSDSSAAGSPSVPAAEELSVRAFFERLAVVRARDGDAVSFGSLLVSGLSEDVEELVPGDDAPPSSGAGAELAGGSVSAPAVSGSAAFVAPP